MNGNNSIPFPSLQQLVRLCVPQMSARKSVANNVWPSLQQPARRVANFGSKSVDDKRF
jgi:hypothetical protein